MTHLSHAVFLIFKALIGLSSTCSGDSWLSNVQMMTIFLYLF